MLVEYVRNPNDLLYRAAAGYYSAKIERYPIAFVQSYPLERVVTHRCRPFHVANALRDALSGILQLKDALTDRDFPDKTTACIEHGDMSQIVLFSTPGELHMQYTMPNMDLATKGVFEPTCVYLSMIHEYAAAKTNRRIGTHTIIGCAVKSEVSQEASTMRLPSYPPCRAADSDLIRFEMDVQMIQTESVKPIGFRNRFVRQVAVPVFLVETALNTGRPSDALVYANQCQAKDWQMALHNWIQESVQ